MGAIASEFEKSHEVYGEGFYMVDVLVKRLSGSEDRIPLMVSERLVDVTQSYIGEYIQVQGQFRSYNRHEEKKNRLVLSVFVRELTFVEEEDESIETNLIELNGYICKPPVHRMTPLGREIADILLGCEQALWKIRLHTVHLLGQKRQFRQIFRGGRTPAYLGQDPEQGIY